MKKSLYTSFMLIAVISAKAQTPVCDASLWNHVYNSYRLHIDSACMEVTGIIYSMSNEADGDIHIRLTVDSPFLYLLNASNYSGEYGKLVCEPVCVNTVTQSDAISSCVNFTNTVYIPNQGERVIVTGPYVTDNDHGWNEIHPITSITIPGATGITVLDTTVMNGFKVYPVPADDEVSFEFAAAPLTATYISIYDAMGRTAGDYQLAETKKLDVPSTWLPEGIYYYSIRQSAGILRQGQFLIVHMK